MDITITKTDLVACVKEEVSRIAAGMYSEDGSSLYDGLKVTSRDEGFINTKITEALSVVHMALIRFVSEIDNDQSAITISLSMSSRRELGKENVIPEFIKNAMVNMVISKYFSEKQQAELVKQFDELAAADIQLLTKNMYHKAAPSF